VSSDIQGMVAVLSSVDGIRHDLQTHQMSIQDQETTQGQMVQTLLTLSSTSSGVVVVFDLGRSGVGTRCPADSVIGQCSRVIAFNDHGQLMSGDGCGEWREHMFVESFRLWIALGLRSRAGVLCRSSD
jgi:hypothetical protein